MSKYINVKNQSRVFLILILLMSALGFFIFLSASLGMIGNEISSFVHIGLKQFIVLIVGLVVMIAVSNIPYEKWRKHSIILLIFSIILTALIFLPGLGISSGGATRWLGFGGFTFQPGELLKLGFVVYFAAWLAKNKKEAGTFTKGVLPLVILLGVSAGLLLAQPDTGTFLVIACAGIAQLLVGGGKWRHLAILGLLGIMALVVLVLSRPYLMDRIHTFFNPAEDISGSAYQLNQSLIAIGSGGIYGRGFGQSLQKFNNLPQPIGDSIFAVASEEFGFVGSIVLLILFLIFAILGLKIASRTKDDFGRLMVVGLVILIVSQSFANMGAMLGLIPLTGEPLIFVSQGGSALLFGLTSAGIILNISRYQTKNIKQS